MAAFYQDFTSANTNPDFGSLVNTLRGADATIGVQHVEGTQAYRLKKATAWLPGQVAAAQNVIDNALASSPQLQAQNEIDHWPITIKALALMLVDQINVLRQAQSLPPVTPAQALAAIRTKAGQL